MMLNRYSPNISLLMRVNWPTTLLATVTLLLVSPSVSAVSAQEASATDRAAEPATPATWYGEGVRPSEARTAEDERQGFHLPKGFVVDLVAAEPQISKPLNLAFDAQGRLWVTDSLEYPYQATGDSRPRDTLRIIEDTDGDGSFDKTTTFADGLNIPIGVLPYGDGAICFSIPNIWYLRDTNHDGVCDQREIILGPFDTTRDTHGMVNALRRGDDGWIYACHGFNNQSTVEGRDGHKVTLISGNTFRFKPDGSRVELVSQGQVNPFGMDSDDRGQYYTADCHSKPITQVIRGACYPSFGRPHDGLGFAHSMMDHLHGSTAIAGLVFYHDDRFPEIFRDSFLSGNVMTSRINRNTRKRVGSTEFAIEQGDFMTSDDSWFRPVDLRLGPDGSLYVADFYNKIIGHYEVPLTHPGRDRHRGRIWRIRYAPNGELAPTTKLNLTTATPQELVLKLASSNATTRQLALDELTDRCGDGAAQALVAGLSHNSPSSRYLSMWGLQRIGALDAKHLEALAQDSDPLVRLHVARLLGISRPESETLLLRLLKDNDADVVRVATESLGLQNSSPALLPLLELLQRFQTAQDDLAKDSVMIQTIRIAIRNLLQKDAARAVLLKAWNLQPSAELQSLAANGPHGQAIASILLGLPHQDAATLLQRKMMGAAKDQALSANTSVDNNVSPEVLQHISRWIDPNELSAFVAWLENTHAQSPLRQLQLLQSVESGLTARGIAAPEVIHEWARRLAVQLLTPWEADPADDSTAVSWGVENGELWKFEKRNCDDGTDYANFQSSLTRGESYTGTLRSGPFKAPESLTFWIVGHNGFPNEANKQANRCELVAADSGAVLKTAFPPRSDVAQPIRWELSDHLGKPVFVRCVDADNANAYAWIGVGRFSHPSLNADDRINELRQALQLIARYSLRNLAPQLTSTSNSKQLDDKAQLECLAVLAQLKDQSLLQSSAEYASQDLNLATTWNQALHAATQLPTEDLTQWQAKELPSLIKPLSTRQQTQLVRTIAARTSNLNWLLDAFDSGTVSLAVLRDTPLRDLLSALYNKPDYAERWQNVLAAVPQEDDAALKRWTLLTSQTATQSDSSLNVGRQIFVEKCSQCHQLANEGKLVGPQLDGVGKRTNERLLEDILLPNRNVDHAFRTTTLLLEDGRVLVGLVRNESAESLTLVDSEGKEQSIAIQDISERKQNTQSVMPANFHELLDDKAVLNLLAFLRK